jgi:hypothetical protein
MNPPRTILTLGPVAVADERGREDIDTEAREFSVTLTSHDGNESWGEFFSAEQAWELKRWLTEATQDD